MVLYNGTILKVNVRDSSGKYRNCDNVISFEPKFQNKISCFLSRTGKCGSSRGVTGLFYLLQIDESIDSHLASIHLSREDITEWKLILARAGFFDLEESVVAKMTVCAKHRKFLASKNSLPISSAPRASTKKPAGGKEPAFHKFGNAEGHSADVRCFR